MKLPQSGAAPVLSVRAAGLILLACLFCGFFAGGLRDPLAAAPVLACVWLAALLGPLPARAAWRPWPWFLGWITLSLLASPQPLTGLAAVSRWAGLAVFFTLAASWWEVPQRRIWFWGLAWCGAILAAAAFWIEIPNYPKVGILPPYYNYTAFVEAALFSGAFAACLRQNGLKGLARWAAGLLALLALAHILWSSSRGGLMAAGAGAGVFVWRHASRRRLLPVFSAMLLILGAGVFLATWAKWGAAKAFKRPDIWKAAAAISRENPVLGAGPGEFARAFLKHNFPAGYGAGNYRFRAEHAHSEFWEAGAEFGWPGLILLLCALGASLRPGRPEDSTWSSEAGLAAFAAMSTQCLVDNMLHLPALGMLYASALAVAAPQSGAEQVSRRAWRAGAGLGLVLAGVAWIPAWLLPRWQTAAPGDWRGREELLLRAVRLAPADPDLRGSLAQLWLERKPPLADEALGQLAQAQRLDPFNAVYPETRAELLARRGDWAQALDFAGQAVALEPEFFQPRLLRAEVFLRLGRREEARAELAEVCRRGLARGILLNGPYGTGYEKFILSLDRGRYAALARLAGPGEVCPALPASN